ncbi:MAG: hypothetical protein FWF52_00570 [Candidatus Azobacteroides sp.]|nr:hypothetical protein [Candidatus Azobacteroides sp.]
MNAAKISCMLALMAIVLFVIVAIFSKGGSAGLDGLLDLKWVLPLLLVIAIIVIVGFIFSIMAIIKDRTVLSWICFIVYLLPLIFMFFINPIVDNYTYKKREADNSWEKRAKAEQKDYWKIEPSSIILVQTNTDIIYLTNIRKEERNDLIDLPFAETDDFFICFDQKALNKRNLGSKISYTMHVIPDNGIYKTELRMDGNFLYVNGVLVEQREVSNEWSRNDEMCSQVLDYYLAHQCEIKK